jgi:Na+/proline symporter
VLFFLLRKCLTTGLLGVGFIGVFSILISTVDSFMNIAAVSLVHDVLKPVFNDEISDKSELNLARLCTMLISIMVCILSIKFDEILDIMLYALSLWAPIMTVPLYFILFKLKVHKFTFHISLCSSALILILWENNSEGMDEILRFIPGTIISLVIFTSSWLSLKYNAAERLFSQSK